MSLLENVKGFFSRSSRDLEVSRDVDPSLTEMGSNEIWKFINSVHEMENDKKVRYQDYDDMSTDSVIQSAMELMADDATQTDPNKNKTVWVESIDHVKIEKELKTTSPQ